MKRLEYKTAVEAQQIQSTPDLPRFFWHDPANAAKVHDYLSSGALAPDGLLDRETMEAAINEAREASGIKRGVKTEEIFDLRLTQRVNDELQGWKP